MHLTLREMQNKFLSPIKLAIYCAAALIVTIISPFGTDSFLSLSGRIAYWGGLIFTICILADVIGYAMRQLLRDRSTFLAPLVSGLVSGLSVAILIFLLNRMIWGTIQGPPNFLELAIIVMPIILVVSMTVHFILKNMPEGKEEEANTPFLDRLPHHLGTELLYLTMQDHYVDVTTSKGKEMILMRFSDAMKKLHSYDGLQIHRSHWIARDAVTGHRRQDGKLFLQFNDGTELPVSRSYVVSAKKALRL
jgi:hypothetical protein